MTLREWLARLRGLFGLARPDADLAEEPRIRRCKPHRRAGTNRRCHERSDVHRGERRRGEILVVHVAGDADDRAPAGASAQRLFVMRLLGAFAGVAVRRPLDTGTARLRIDPVAALRAE
jgi:hypothetical protein